jgi:hypothetical protein
MITEVKAQDIKVDDLVIFYDDPDGDSDDYTTYRVEVAHPTVVTTMINRYDVIELKYREEATGDLHTRQVHPEYPFRILKNS